tara:strand:- start:2738 stop:2938 length:201 start_codon:yes stop_codon:yes gene_type:complete
VSKAFSETQTTKEEDDEEETFQNFTLFSHKNQDVAKLTVVVVSKDLPARRDDDDGRRRLWRFEYNE